MRRKGGKNKPIKNYVQFGEYLYVYVDQLQKISENVIL